jgi:hypothetical protein
MARFDDVRRWAAVRTGGIVRLLLDAEGHLVDVEGAVDACHADLAATFAHSLVRQLVSIVSLLEGGPIENRYTDPNFDWLQDVDPALVDRALGLAVQPLADGADWRPDAWLEALRGLVAEVEARLSLDAPMPRLRSSDGMFDGLALARDWVELCGELGVPLAALVDA